MPELSEITYSPDACVTAVRDYYSFLTKMYLEDSKIILPPEGGWPTISSADRTNLRSLGKAGEVTWLLAHLRYIRADGDNRDKAHGTPGYYFADWQILIQWLTQGRISGGDLKIIAEGSGFYEGAPPHVIGLTSGGQNNQVFVLDTKLGIIHWPECPDEIRHYSL